MSIGFTYPWLLAGLAALPALWWLLRATPPAPRRQIFPAVALLLGLSTAATPARTPWWLLLVRLSAVAMAIIGLAGPVHDAPRPAAGHGPVLLVIDNGWGAAADWPARLRAASGALATAAAPETPASLLATAPGADAAPLASGPTTRLAELGGRLATLNPMPWPTDRAAAADALRNLPRDTRVIYVADGIASPGDAAFADALSRFAAVTELRDPAGAPLILRPPATAADPLVLQAATLPGHPVTTVLRVLDATGQDLAETTLGIDGSGTGEVRLVLPPELRNRATALRLGDATTAAATVLLDEASRRRPVGLVASGGGQDQPLIGPLYFVRRALDASTDLHEGPLASLLATPLSVIVVADQPLADPAGSASLAAWVRHGGLLIRFAGPTLAAGENAAPDPLLPAPLLAGDRALGGAMSWSRPVPLAAFRADSPFAGLVVPPDVRISRQVLTQPASPGAQVWATLEDATPLVTAAPLGAGHVVLFHVTANAAWSNLPLSGLFPAMLHRLVQLAAGIRPGAEKNPLSSSQALDGFGQLGLPGSVALPMTEAEIAITDPGPRHPPGLYGPTDGIRAYNLGAVLPKPVAAAPLAFASQRSLAAAPAAQPLGPWLLVLALVLLAADLLLALNLRGLLAAAALLGLLQPARAAPPDMPSLATHLAYVVTGDSQADGISRAGLQGLSDYVNQRTAAALADPVAIDPAQDDLSFYPLLYWPILADAAMPDGAAIARLDEYMENGGIILFDTRDAGAPDAGVEQSLRRIGTALAIPALTQLTPSHVLSHSFYLLRDWPGRLIGGPVWVSRTEDPANDSVSPVIIGANDWAAAWAVDDAGANPYEATPGGEAQRLLAYRFGVNLVIYALTGSYKADQLQVPELLRRMHGTDPADEAQP